MAYSGDRILAADLLFRPAHSVIDQSLHGQLGATTTNGDGFGSAGTAMRPNRGCSSPRNRRGATNLREIAYHVRTPLLFAHVRASTGTAVQRSNCHPFRHGRWLWMHNGPIRGFRDLRRDLVLAVDPHLYPDIEGTTDSALLFFLALTLGLADDPFEAVARAVGQVESIAGAHQIAYQVQMTVATSDGESV